MTESQRARKRQQQIIEGMRRVMSERGYERTSIAAVAKEAELSPGLLHYYFPNKQAILIALVEKLFAGLEERFGRRLARAPSDAWQRLYAFLDAHLAIDDDADPDAVKCWVSIGSEALLQGEVRAVYLQIVERELQLLEGLLQDVLRHEKRNAEHARQIAAGLLATIEGSYQLATLAPQSWPDGNAAAWVRRQAHALVSAEPLLSSTSAP
ncbi:MAG: TetR/AcrR family transcriptional regulator [Myxococcales bacterium]|nr:TetR/AcrR family transcriptional regulator [Myxococcales bacterium]MCB9643417.1 TetR/AcrR family transcriptional regulator [Myxococcales bacterium]